MSSSSSSVEETKAFLQKAFRATYNLDFDRLPEFYAKDLVSEDGLEVTNSLDGFIAKVKRVTASSPPFKAAHTLDSFHIHDGMIYMSSKTDILFEAAPDAPFLVTAFQIVDRKPMDDPVDGGKIKRLIVYEDRLPFVMRAQSLGDAAK